MPRIPDRTDWLDPDQPDVVLGTGAEPVDVEVEVGVALWCLCQADNADTDTYRSMRAGS
jgi:hypothetical protein